VVSKSGGGSPSWSADGADLYFVSNDDQLMAASVRAGDDTTFIADPRPVFGIGFFQGGGRRYAVAPDGQRVLLIEPERLSPITVTLNWATKIAK
jgi:hypothetical protein